MTYMTYNAQHPRGMACFSFAEAVRYCTGWMRAWVEDADGEVVYGERQPFTGTDCEPFAETTSQ